MDATQNRQTNFLALFRAFRDQHPDEPTRGMLKKFSEKVEISDRYLSHVKCGRKQLGAALARQMETKCGKPHGWLDQVHDDGTPEDGDERVLIEQILALYRNNPGTVKRIIADSIKTILSDPKNGPAGKH